MQDEILFVKFDILQACFTINMETIFIFLIFFMLTLPALILAIILSLIVLVLLFLKRRKPGKGRSLDESLPVIAVEETVPVENSVPKMNDLPEAGTLAGHGPVSEIEEGEEPLVIVPKWSEADCKSLFRAFTIARLKACGFKMVSKSTGDEILIFQTEEKEHHEASSIAVVGVWKPGFIKGRIEWARSFQMIVYRQHEKTENIPVLVLIGIGGTPEVPESVYIVPLKHIRSNVLSEIQLKSFLLPSDTGVAFESAV
jgi:hypothetical protein